MQPLPTAAKPALPVRMLLAGQDLGAIEGMMKEAGVTPVATVESLLEAVLVSERQLEPSIKGEPMRTYMAPCPASLRSLRPARSASVSAAFAKARQA